jgi:exonuclease III
MGITVLLSHKDGIKHISRIFEIPGRAIVIYFEAQGKRVLLVSVYAPANREERPDFYASLLRNLQQIDLDFDVVVFTGDFNVVENAEVDRVRHEGAANAPEVGLGELQAITDFLGVYDLDASNLSRNFTYFSSAHNSQSRIDRMYCTNNMSCYMKRMSYNYADFSDHKLVGAMFSNISDDM